MYIVICVFVYLFVFGFRFLQGEQKVWSVDQNRGDRWVLKYATILSKKPYKVKCVCNNYSRTSIIQTFGSGPNFFMNINKL